MSRCQDKKITKNSEEPDLRMQWTVRRSFDGVLVVVIDEQLMTLKEHQESVTKCGTTRGNDGIWVD